MPKNKIDKPGRAGQKTRPYLILKTYNWSVTDSIKNCHQSANSNER